MKKLIAVAGLGAAITLGTLAGAGAAHADSGYTNYRYLQGLNNNGIYILNTNVAISHGHVVCNMLDNGNTAYDAQRWLATANPTLARRGAYNWVGVAAEYYCPWNNDLVYAPASY
jgi:hypothetical protein